MVQGLKKVFRGTTCLAVISIIFSLKSWSNLFSPGKVQSKNISLDGKLCDLIRSRYVKDQVHGYTRVKLSCGFLYQSNPTRGPVQVSEEAELYAKTIMHEKGTGYIDFQMPDKAWETVDYGFVSFPSQIQCNLSRKRETSQNHPSIFLSTMLTVDGFRPRLLANFIEHYSAIGILSENMLFTVQITHSTKVEHLNNLVSFLRSKDVYFDIFLVNSLDIISRMCLIIR